MNSRIPIGCVSVIWVLFSCMLLFIGYTEFTGQSNGYSLQYVKIATNLDEYGNPIDNSTIFSSTTSRIYCIAKMRGILGFPNGGDMVFRWYYKDQMFTGQLNIVTSIWSEMVYIEPSNSQFFEPGQYRVEVELKSQGTPHLKVIEFTVE